MNCSEGCDSSEAWDREYQTSVELGEALREVETLRARADAAEKDAAFHKMSALAFEDLHEAAEKRARDAEEKLAYRHAIDDALEANRDIVEALAQHDRIERETIAAVVAWLRCERAEVMTTTPSDAREAEDAKLVCGIFGDSADAIEQGLWRPKGREGGE